MDLFASTEYPSIRQTTMRGKPLSVIVLQKFRVLSVFFCQHLNSPTFNSRIISIPRCYSRHRRKLVTELRFGCSQRCCQRCHLFKSPLEIITRHKQQQLPLVFICVDDDFKMGLEQMASVSTTLIETKTEISNELTYMFEIASSDANSPDLECGGMQVKSCQKKTLRI